MTGVGVAATVAALCLALGASAASEQHEKFVPLIAFKCGFRNRYMAENGSWVSDSNKFATCLDGKLDMLKYCKKSYPSLNVTNIVEYNHEVTLADWCREEGDKCVSTRTVRPYRCIVGEFHSEALQVPHDCRFNHENSRDMCNDYTSWKNEATRLCSQRKDDAGKNMVVRSFAMLEPCGLDLFTGVEYVCCPTDDDNAALISKNEKNEDKKKADEEDEDDDDDESTEDDTDSEEDAGKTNQRDVYFVDPFKDLVSEHDRYRQALDRMEQKHRVKVDKVMKEWNELDERYKKQKTIDPVKAELFKKEMANRFQTTVASLEEEHRKMRKEIEEVHEERVQSSMNEKKRQATHEYRAALADAVAIPDKHKVLKTLKAYIRAEEKDRIHTLNRFRHLLREDTQEAMNIKAMTVHRLRYIDLRINGTVAMLKDLPSIDVAIRPIAMAFWNDFRRENTPEMTGDLWKKIEAALDKDQALVDNYEQEYRKLHPESFARVKIPAYTKEAPLAHSDKQPTTAVPATQEPAKVLPKDETDSEEDDDSYYEDDNDEEMKKTKKTEKKTEIKKETIKVVKEDIVHPPIVAVDDDSDDDDEDEDEDDEKDSRKELRVDIEPIIDEHSRESVHILPYGERLSKRTSASWPFSSSGYLFFFITVALVGFACFALVGLNRRRRNIRFVEVDVCSPEERHVNGMQINGYENPTYSFFDSKA
ncbi:hypothetical protein PFISCL1PPCAC_26659 [Pristionchus fissidentatus]|uniref:A4_EXTRA domain-containing protein n=1 Tax=Pristionchus fissidentatus TaxID=1538716 RepID=A0AAV5WTL2_9BILA|nr:hypothetical protein PFISCL1PPCAC_26659 [Pristionchus fissidentatus]